MIRLAASICLVPEITGGPFLFDGDLAGSCRRAAEAGFDAVEILVPDAEAINVSTVRELLKTHGLRLSGLGTGAGFLTHRLHLASPDSDIRKRAISFATSIIDTAGDLGAFAIIGSLKGSVERGVDRKTAIDWLTDGLQNLADRAGRHGVPLILEPLNRYESNYINRLDEVVDLIKTYGLKNVKLLADLFHMNIEEVSLEKAMRAAALHLGHIHFVDSNRRPPGAGHIDFAAIGHTLSEIEYHGFLAVEAIAYPNSDEAARQALRAFRQHIAINRKA